MQEKTKAQGGLVKKAQDALHVTRVNKLIEAVVLIALGLVLFIWSKTALDVICMVISLLLAIMGVIVIVMYFFGRSSIYGSAIGLFAGVVAAVLGLYLFFNPHILESLGPIIVGLIILVTGLVDLSEAFRIAKQKSGGQVAALVIAVLEIVFGVIFVLHPDFLNAVIMKLMAICLMADGVADIWVMFQIGKGEKAVKQAVNAVQNAVKDAAAVAADAGEMAADTENRYSDVSSQETARNSGYTTIPHRHEEKDAGKTETSFEENAPDEKTSEEKAQEEKKESGIPSADDIATELPPEEGPTAQG